MATCGRQNCDSVCASFGLQCAGTGQSFPNPSALSIFQSLGITCETSDYTDFYHYQDQPNYISTLPQGDVNLQWAGRCTGFKAIPSTIDCHTANNSNVRRLCPCHNSSGRHWIIYVNDTENILSSQSTLSAPTRDCWFLIFFQFHHAYNLSSGWYDMCLLLHLPPVLNCFIYAF